MINTFETFRDAKSSSKQYTYVSALFAFAHVKHAQAVASSLASPSFPQHDLQLHVICRHSETE